MGGPFINPNDPSLHMRCSKRDAARRDANVASIRDRKDVTPSIVIGGKAAIPFCNN